MSAHLFCWRAAGSPSTSLTSKLQLQPRSSARRIVWARQSSSKAPSTLQRPRSEDRPLHSHLQTEMNDQSYEHRVSE